MLCPEERSSGGITSSGGPGFWPLCPFISPAMTAPGWWCIIKMECGSALPIAAAAMCSPSWRCIWAPVCLEMQARAAAEGYQRKGPLVFHGRLCLVPVKFREQKRKNNGTLGYINAQAVARIFQNDDGSSVLYFQDNAISLIALQRKATVQRHVQQGLSLLAGYGEQVAPEQMQAVGAVYPWEQGFGQTVKHGVMDSQ